MPIVSWNSLIKRFNPAEESFNDTAHLVVIWIEPGWSPAFRMFLRSPIDRDIAFDPSFLVVLSDFSGIVGCICGDGPGTSLHLTSLAANPVERNVPSPYWAP